MSEGQGLATQLAIGIEEGMKRDSWVHCDDLRNIQKSVLTRWVGTLPPEKMRKLDYALAVALDLPL
jgi:mRNA interferase MazF